MSTHEPRALAMARELQGLLEELNAHPEHGPGSCVEDALMRMEDVIGMLEPFPEEDDPVLPVPHLRLVQVAALSSACVWHQVTYT